MVGDPGSAVIADLFAGHQVDVDAAYALMKKSSDTLDGNPLRPESRNYAWIRAG